MIYRVHIKFITNFLGGGPRDKKTQVRLLNRTHENHVALHSQDLMKKLELANEHLNAELDIGKFKIPDGFEINHDSISKLKRVYNKVNIDWFEGIQKGKKIKLDIMFEDTSDKAPKVELVSSLFDVIGRFHGISQWGAKFHCGRFKVSKTERVTIENYDN